MTSQLARHPAAPCRRLSSGTSQPESRIAKPLPLTMKPAARPRARLPNHAATSDIIGTLAAPLPRPVRK